MLISDLRDAARDAALDFAWGQWSQLGLSGYSGAADRRAIDPEALILFTIEVARHDPRLFDESLDWIATNRGILSYQRLSNLADRFAIDPELLAAVTETAVRPRRSLQPSGEHLSASATDLTPLFSSNVLTYVGAPDITFAAHGYLRPQVVLSGKSGQPDTHDPACLAILLRTLFGPGSRSEALRVLLSYQDGPLDVARIADESGFARRNVADALVALASANALMARWSGNERVFAASRHQWAAFFGLASADDLPDFVSWTHLLPATVRLLGWLDESADSSDSEYLISSRSRDLAGEIGPDLAAAGVAPPRPASGSRFLESFVDLVHGVLGALQPAS
jgi:hypothetical protein